VFFGKTAFAKSDAVGWQGPISSRVLFKQCDIVLSKYMAGSLRTLLGDCSDSYVFVYSRSIGSTLFPSLIIQLIIFIFEFRTNIMFMVILKTLKIILSISYILYVKTVIINI